MRCAWIFARPKRCTSFAQAMHKQSSRVVLAQLCCVLNSAVPAMAELFVKAHSEFASLSQRARLELAQLDQKLMEIFQADLSRVDQKLPPKYFSYILTKPPASLLKPAPAPAPASQPLPVASLQRHAVFPSSQPQPQAQAVASEAAKPSLKRSRSAFGVEAPPGPSYNVGHFASEATLLADEVFLHTEASPPCVRPRISANVTPQSPKVVNQRLELQTLELQAQPLREVFEFPRVATAPREEDQYSISSYSETDTERKAEQDERRRKRRAKKRVPGWCRDWQYLAKMQQQIDPDAVFFTLQAFPKCELKKIFGDKDKFHAAASSDAGNASGTASASTARRKKHRGSSGNWGVDGLTDLEIINYKKLMGQIPGNTPGGQHQSRTTTALQQTQYELSLNITSISSQLGNSSSCVPTQITLTTSYTQQIFTHVVRSNRAS